MPLPGSSAEVVGQPGQPLLGGRQPDHAEPQARSRASGRAPSHRDARPAPSCSATSATTRSLAVAVVASTGTPGGQVAEQVRMRR
jgi:hypothetical protein